MKIAATNKWLMWDKRLAFTAAIPGILFSLATVLGGMLRTHSGFQPLVWSDWLMLMVWALTYFIALYLLFSLMNHHKASEAKQENWISRISGNGFLVFLLLLICWTPVFLAFWPGHFSADSLTQFYSYYNEDPYAHHPLLHTALLGFCMMTGIDNSPEGLATNGLALYCSIQLVVVAACIAYGCWWMKRRGVPCWIRLVITCLFAFCPFYAPWTFCAQKDVLFAVLAMLFCLQLCDVWQFGMKPLRMIVFIVIAVLMMLFRNNGVYALVLLLPFAVWWAHGKRLAVGALLIVSAVLYLVINNAWIYVVDAERGSKVEILSMPLQQIARTLQQDPEAIELDEEGVLDTLYWETNIAEIYHPQISDPVKWAVDYDALDENIPSLLSLWLRMAPGHLIPYTEAFLLQNLPYILPYSDMLYRFDFTVHQIEWFPIEQHSYLPKLRSVYETYDETLSFLKIPGTHLLSDTAFFVWLCIAGFAYACYRQEQGLMMAFGFLMAIWITCLLGPVAIMRYMLSLFYTVPLLIGRLVTHEKDGGTDALEA